VHSFSYTEINFLTFQIQPITTLNTWYPTGIDWGDQSGIYTRIVSR